MPKQGRPKRLVNAAAEYWPIKKLEDLPEMRGIYILYDKNYKPVYCGRAGRGVSEIKDRVRHEKRWRYYGSKIAYFSAFDLHRGNHHQVETLILHAIGDKILKWNVQKNNWPSTTIEHDWREA